MLENWRIKNKKSGKVGYKISKKAFYEVKSKNYWSNQTNMNINMKQIYCSSYRLCNQVGRGKGTQNQYCNSYN
jgi:hypothetical protein